MEQPDDFEIYEALSRAAQQELLRSLRPRTAHVELVFHDNDAGSPITELLAPLAPTREVGVGPRLGYAWSQPRAVLHRYDYDRSIFRVFDQLGGLFEYVPHPHGDRVEFTRLGNVDVTLLDARERVLLSTVTHEGMVLVSQAA